MDLQATMRWLRWVASLIVLAVLGWIFRDELTFLQEGFARLRTASIPAVLVVTASSLLSLLTMSQVMRLLIRAGGVPVSFRETTAITLASNAWSTTLPAGAAFSAILTYNVQRSWGATVALRGWFLVLSSAVSTAWLALIGLSGVLFLRASLGVSALISSLVLIAVAISLLFWLTNNPQPVERWLQRQRVITGKVRNGLAGQVKNLEFVHLSRWQFASMALYSLGHRLFDMIALWGCVWAVTGDIAGFSTAEDRTTLAGVALAYITAKLAGSAQVTPAGLGTVEAALIATLVATGMTAVDATGAAIIYRLISFAAMTAIGWVVYFLHYARTGLNYKSLRATPPQIN
ncbi:MAG: YbhN family protein [Corynebacterium sp.]|nr:YbhN family protein [Corynebacterium sp.]